MAPILQKLNVNIGTGTVDVHEMSAFDYMGYLDYINELGEPEPLGDDATHQELKRSGLAWQRVTFQGHSRMAAYGLMPDNSITDIDEMQELVQKSYSREGLKILHDATAQLSGFGATEKAEPSVDETSEVDNATDPKA